MNPVERPARYGCVAVRHPYLARDALSRAFGRAYAIEAPNGLFVGPFELLLFDHWHVVVRGLGARRGEHAIVGSSFGRKRRVSLGLSSVVLTTGGKVE